MNEAPNFRNRLIRDLIIIIISIALAVFLAYNGIFENVLTQTKETEILGSFISGLFFTSVFTTAPATVALGEIAQDNSIFMVALVGGAGALLGDLLLFNFFKSNLTDDLVFLIAHNRRKRFLKIFRLRIFRWLFGLLGAIIIASPLPDELGLALLGLSKLKLKILIPISFTFNFLGILVIGLVARQLV